MRITIEPHVNIGLALLASLLVACVPPARGEDEPVEAPTPLIQEALDRALGDGGDPGGEDAAATASHHPSRLIVRFRTDMVPGQRAVTHTTARADRVVRRARFVDGLTVVEVPEDEWSQALASYRTDPNVLYVEPDFEIRIGDLPNDPSFDRLWGMENTGQTLNGFFCFPTGTVGADIRALEAWDVWTGDPDFRIAVIDTGINYEHPDLAANVWTNPGEIAGNGIDDDGNGWIDDIHGYDFHNGDSDPLDDHRHGSHVAGTIGAVGNNDLGVVGVNHQCSLVALKTFDENGSGFVSTAVEAMEYVIANGIRVSNNSWGCSSADAGCFSQALFDVIQASQSVDHIFVAAAGNKFGNDNDDIPYYPVSYDLDNIIAVAALDNRDGLAFFSNFGANSVDVAAPGACIYSTMLGSDYGYLDGTSMATPHVTGLVGLVMSRLPELTGPQVRERIFKTVRPVPALEGMVATGGVIHAGAAVWDCNTNGVLDEEDIASGESSDCNGNQLPDECEPDCNENGVADGCDIDAGTSLDCSGNGIPDECEPDCNGNGVPDSCDIADGVSQDCDGEGNGIPDECENDCDGNGVADSCDVARGAPDCNRNGIPDICEPGGDADCNDNDTADLCDIFIGRSRDCNENAVPDECDVASGSSEDCTGNGVPDECEPDCNQNSIADSCDIASGFSTDCSHNGRPDECEPDCNGNGVADVCDIRNGDSGDCNINRIPDECEPGGRPEDDCNGNNQPDLCDVYAGLGRDCNSNGVLDLCDVDAGVSADVNVDGVPDECEGKGFRLIPIGASGPHVIEESEILLDEAGQTVELELRISGWDLDGDGAPTLRGYQAEVDASGFSSALYGELDLAQIPCASNEDCPGWQAECLDTGYCSRYAAVGIDTTRPDFVFYDLFSVWVVNLISNAPDFFILSALFSAGDSVADPGEEKYAGTILLDVPPLAGGTFTIDLNQGNSIFGSSAGLSISIPTFAPVRITIPSDCNDNGQADQEDVASGQSADCNGNGIPDECLHIETDCNGNGSPDDCDIADGVSEDCTLNGVPDECEPDCNGNFVADSCDIAGGASMDINTNDVPDECDPRRDIYVDVEGCFFPGSGTEDDPYCNIQQAIESAGSGRDALVEIVVADGLYRGPGNKNIEFNGRALTLRSANGPQGCIIDAEGDGRGFVFGPGDDQVRLRGFTVVNGSSTSGGGIFCSTSNPIMESCIIRDCYAERFGGGMHLFRANPTIRNCAVSNNTAEFFYGGGIYCSISSPKIFNTYIVDNQADLGGAVFGSSSAPVMRNVTVAFNRAGSRGGGFYFTGGGSRPEFRNSMLWGNDADSGREMYLSVGANLTAGYSLIRGGKSLVELSGGTLTWEEGNLDADPKFVDAAGGDYHLSPMSPGIDGGDPAFEPSEGETDTDGDARVLLDGVDMGADEATAFADCNGDERPDGREIALDEAADCNENDVLDQCDIAEGTSPDSLPPTGDGVPDECQSDCNNNTMPDTLDLAEATSLDCNENLVPDECDIAEGVSADCDGDGIPDDCKPFGDVNASGLVNVLDAFCVLEAVSGVYDNCTIEDADIGDCVPDGEVDLVDVMAVLDAIAGINPCCS